VRIRNRLQNRARSLKIVPMPATIWRPTVAVCLLSLTHCSPAGTDQSSAGGGKAGTSSGQAGSAAGGNPNAGGSAAGSGGAGSLAGASTAGGGGSAGAASGGSGGSGGKAGGNAPCDGADIFCSEFEAEALPSELTFWPEYLRATQTNFVSIDKTLAKTGQGSLKVVGSESSQMLGVPVPSKFWGRVYLRSDTDIQSGHNTYMAAGTSSGDPNMGTYVRIGEHQCQLELNRSSDDKELLSNGGTYMCEGGVKLLKDTWYCVEFSYDGPGQEIRVFVDDQEISALHATACGPYEYKVFKLGFEKYHGMNKTLWYDDLALGTSQIGCLND
jgi:hypothetical protein